MSQAEILEVLKAKRASGDLSYFSAKEIQRILNGKGTSINIASINTSLCSLRRFDILETRLDAEKKGRATYPFIVYRVKKELI